MVARRTSDVSEATRISSKRVTENFDPACGNGDKTRPLSSQKNGGNYGSRRTSLAAWGSNPDHHFALTLLALNHAAHADRAHKGDKRYVRRKSGKFIKSPDDVGRSLAADRRKRAKRVVASLCSPPRATIKRTFGCDVVATNREIMQRPLAAPRPQSSQFVPPQNNAPCARLPARS